MAFYGLLVICSVVIGLAAIGNMYHAQYYLGQQALYNSKYVELIRERAFLEAARLSAANLTGTDLGNWKAALASSALQDYLNMSLGGNTISVAGWGTGVASAGRYGS